MNIFRRSFLLALFVSFALAAFGQSSQNAFRVTVIDLDGLPISTATVTVTGTEGTRDCTNQGSYYLCDPMGAPVTVSASGDDFQRITRAVTAADTADGIELLLTPFGIRESVTISAGVIDLRLGETPQSVVIIGQREIDASAAPTIDDTLRQVPGFSTFRRAGSRFTNPTTQGVSLRGAGSSGASRSAVLFDGVPVNDPFGGWVQWTRIPPMAVSQIEVVRGGASSAFGTSSLSGAVNIVPKRVDGGTTFSGEAYLGTLGTLGGSFFGGIDRGGWSFDASGGVLNSSGYIPVAEEFRGPVDTSAGVQSYNLYGRLLKRFGDRNSIFIRPSYFDESRDNGTELQENSTHSRGISIGGDHQPFATGPLSRLLLNWRIYGGTQGYDQTFSAVAANRATETLTRVQRSPSQNFGYSGLATFASGGNTIAFGVDGREIRGASDEIGYSGGFPVVISGSGGKETSFAVYAEDVFSFGRVVLTGGLRYDRWENRDGYSVQRPIDDPTVTGVRFPDRTSDAFSPSGSILFRLPAGFALHAAASRNFRAPTLNELYRDFRVGNIFTSANAELLPERSTNFEGGVSFRRGTTYVRLTGFVVNISDAIANVTLNVSPQLITRQRQNAAETRSAGFEIEAERRFGNLFWSGGYTFVDPKVTEFPSNPLLVDNRIPQVPRHVFTTQVRVPYRTWEFATQIRAAGKQFDDDLNQLELGPYLQTDVHISKRLTERFSAFAAIENFFNSRYEIGRTPVETVAPPFTIRIGLRFK